MGVTLVDAVMLAVIDALAVILAVTDELPVTLAETLLEGVPEGVNDPLLVALGDTLGL